MQADGLIEVRSSRSIAREEDEVRCFMFEGSCISRWDYYEGVRIQSGYSIGYI